ncbi:MAG: aldehyde dehydrogenase family protein [Thermoanaerobaculia bacterium]|nr:aldehyde dehydrogenase family protein [Thermoanaerobaculia bacterium]
MSQPADGLEPRERERLDRSLEDLERRRRAWAELPVAGRVGYLRALIEGFRRVAPGQVAAALEAKGIDPASPTAGEEWIAGPYVTVRTLRLLLASLERIRDRGRIEIPAAQLRQVAGGRLAVRVFPTSGYDRLLYTGFTADVWMRDGVTRENLPDHVAPSYRGEPGPGAVALVLGAGNVASIAPLDTAHKLFVEGRVVLLKLNPVNDYLEPFFEDAFAELVEGGFVRIETGGAETGDYLCRHPRVEEIHITGSARTHDAIVFGTGEEGRRRRERGEPRLTKRITSELGNVSPIIVVPGRWSEGDLDFHAENLATQMTQNGGFNCNATKVIVTHAGWPQRTDLLERLGGVLGGIDRVAYYPGAEERWRRFVGAYPQTRIFGEARGEVLPPALAAGLDPADDGPAFREESFCAFTAEVPLEADGAAGFLDRAAEFCNERLDGTLNAGITVHPATRRELGEERLQGAIDRLRYGSVAINHWPALAYGLGSTPWGAYPGHTPTDIQSGIGVVHNTLMLEKTEKAVIDGPFRVFPKPVWFVSHRTVHRVGPHLVELEASPGPLKLPPIFFHALRG